MFSIKQAREKERETKRKSEREGRKKEGKGVGGSPEIKCLPVVCKLKMLMQTSGTVTKSLRLGKNLTKALGEKGL